MRRWTKDDNPSRDFDHPRRCRSVSRVTRMKCRKWALRGSNYCEFHGGRRRSGVNTTTGAGRLPGMYSKHLGPRLKSALEAYLAAPHCEQVALYDEIALARAQVSQALALARPVFEDDPRVKVTAEMRAMALSVLRDSVDHVMRLVSAASKIEKDAEDKVSIRAVNLFIVQIINAVRSVVGDDEALVRRITDAIDEQVRLPLDRTVPKGVDSNVAFLQVDEALRRMGAATDPPAEEQADEQ